MFMLDLGTKREVQIVRYSYKIQIFPYVNKTSTSNFIKNLLVFSMDKQMEN
jgi:hypothetical protein